MMTSLDYSPHSSPYSAPPQTSNALNTKQRIRLVRSTRKLGAVLGATPQVAENEELYPFGAPLTTFPSCSSSSSYSSTSELSRGYRHYPSVSVSEHPTRAPKGVYSSASSTSSSLSLALDEPPARASTLPRKPSMKFRTHSKSKSRPSNEAPRPLVLRLTSVPKALNLPPHSPSPSQNSSLLTPTTPTPTGTPMITPTTPVFPSAAETRRKRMAKLTRTLGEIIPPHLVFGAKKPAQEFAAEEEEEDEELYCEAAQVTPSTPKTRQRRSMSVDLAGQPPEFAPRESRSSRVWVTGNKSWRGEWNRKDIREVQKQLRSLKAR